MRGVAPLLAAALLLSAAACSRNSECTALLAVLEPARDRIKELDQEKPQTPQQIARAMQRRAELQARALEDVNRLKLTQPELQRLAAQYQVLQREIVRGARERARIMGDIAGHGNAGENAGKLEMACPGEKDAASCQAFFEALHTFPQDVDWDTFSATEHSRALAGLEKITFAGGDTRAASTAVIASLRRSITFSTVNQQVHQGRRRVSQLRKDVRSMCRGR